MNISVDLYNQRHKREGNTDIIRYKDIFAILDDIPDNEVLRR